MPDFVTTLPCVLMGRDAIAARFFRFVESGISLLQQLAGAPRVPFGEGGDTGADCHQPRGGVGLVWYVQSLHRLPEMIRRRGGRL